MTSILTRASHEWMTRPADERYVTLKAMQEEARVQFATSREISAVAKRLQVVPMQDHQGLVVRGGQGQAAIPSNWAFKQLAGLCESPVAYLQTLPSEIVADALNWKLQACGAKEMALLLRTDREAGTPGVGRPGLMMNALTGPKYGRIWNKEVIDQIIARFGTGEQGNGSPWQAPGHFGQRIVQTSETTTFYMGESDMFVFLVDEENRIDVPGRGQMFRGFFVWNSEVGKSVLGIATFFYDYVCQNRIVWGATQYRQIKIRHTAGAPVRWEDEVVPALEDYRRSSSKTIIQAIEGARAMRMTGEDATAFIEQRFGKRLAAVFEDVHLDEESRPIESAWDVVTAATAYARRFSNQDTRVDMERKAGEILDLGLKRAA